MNPDPLDLSAHPAVLRHARIHALAGERFCAVSNEGHRYWLTPAVGCLLQPAVGDRVLISLEGSEGYILAILERGGPGWSELRLPKDVALNLAGALHITTQDDLTIQTGASLALCARRSTMQVEDAQLAFTSLRILGEHCESRWIERHDESVHHTQRATRHEAEYGDSRRQVSGHEELEAGSLRQQVSKDWRLHGETLDLFAESSVAVVGERIKLG